MSLENVNRWKILDLFILTVSASTILVFFQYGVAHLIGGLSTCGFLAGIATSELSKARKCAAVWCFLTAVTIVVFSCGRELLRSIERERVTGQPVFEDGFFVSVFIAFPGLIVVYGSLAIVLGFFAGWIGFKFRPNQTEQVS